MASIKTSYPMILSSQRASISSSVLPLGSGTSFQTNTIVTTQKPSPAYAERKVSLEVELGPHSVVALSASWDSIEQCPSAAIQWAGRIDNGVAVTFIGEIVDE